MTGVSFLLKPAVCEISISNHMETMAIGVTQLTFTRSNSTIETLQKGVKYVQS